MNYNPRVVNPVILVKPNEKKLCLLCKDLNVICQIWLCAAWRWLSGSRHSWRLLPGIHQVGSADGESETLDPR